MPSAEVVELAEGYSYSLSEGKEQGARVFIVRGAVVGGCVTEGAALAVLPALGSAWPGGGSGALFLRGYTMSVVDAGCAEGSATAWRVELRYATGSSETQVEEGVPGFVATEVDGRGEMVDTWRVGPFTYLPITASAPLQTDIGGKAVDSGGAAVSFPLRQASLSVRNVLVGAALQTADWVGAIGKRNSDTWQGFTAGYLVYAGVHQTKTGPDTFAVEHRIIYDAYGHLRQVAKVDPTTGEPVLGWVDPATGTPALISSSALGEAQCAYWVQWKQPFYESVAFGGLGIQV